MCSDGFTTGTAFDARTLEGICDLVLEENARRAKSERPLFLLYDQVYWMLTFGAHRHWTPPEVVPESAAYTIFVDGISKAFAATGRVIQPSTPLAAIISRSAFSSVMGAAAWGACFRAGAAGVAAIRLMNDPDQLTRVVTEIGVRFRSQYE